MTCPTVSLALLALQALPTWAIAQEVLSRPEQPFKGHIGRTAKDFAPDFPKPVHAPTGAPNVLLIMTDDVGFGASTTFGGPVPTPTMDRLAKAGLRYTQFHTTALCSPTSAAFLSGRNHHSAATGVVMEIGTGYPGYNSLMPKGTGTFAEVLRQNARRRQDAVHAPHPIFRDVREPRDLQRWLGRGHHPGRRAMGHWPVAR